LFALKASAAQHFEVIDQQFTNDDNRKVSRKLWAARAPGPNSIHQDKVKLWANVANALVGTDKAGRMKQ
jgi:hypothetical protein